MNRIQNCELKMKTIPEIPENCIKEAQTQMVPFVVSGSNLAKINGHLNFIQMSILSYSVNTP